MASKWKARKGPTKVKKHGFTEKVDPRGVSNSRFPKMSKTSQPRKGMSSKHKPSKYGKHIM